MFNILSVSVAFEKIQWNHFVSFVNCNLWALFIINWFNFFIQAGPSGSQFGLLACLFVEIIQNWYILSNPGMAVAKLGFLLLLLFIVGLLPMVDNYAHLIGFVFGFLLSFALLPYITFNLKDKRGKLIGIVVCLVATIGLFIGLIVLFYVSPVYNCPHCHYFNCIPFTPNFCKSMEVQIRR